MSAKPADANGAAFDVAGRTVESDGYDELRAELAELNQLTADEQRRVDRRVEISQEFYRLQARVPGTAAHAAHVAQLRRLRDEAATTLTALTTALVKAREHVAGKEGAIREAETMLDSAELALAEVDGPDDSGSAE